MQNYVAWCSGDLLIVEWCDTWQLIDDIDSLYVKKITLK
jgi:hypothetical protein